MKTTNGCVFFLCLFMLLTLPAMTSAQSDDFAELDSMGEELSLFEEIPSVFGASKYEQKVTEAPSSVSIVTAEEIKKYGYRNLADILRSLRSFYVSDDLGYQYAGVRGFGRPGDYNTRLLMLIDGHRTNDNIYQSAFIGNESPLDINLIERVEVIRGPSSSIYGSSAFFAVINIITKRGRDYQGTEVAVEAASHDTYAGTVSYGDRYGSGFELLISGTGSFSDGDDYYFPEFDDPATNNGRSQDNDDDDNYKLFLKASGKNLTLTSTFVHREFQDPTAAWDTVFNDPRFEVIEKRLFLDLKYDKTFANDWNVSARAYYDYYYYEGLYPTIYEDEPDTVYVGYDDAEGNWWGAEIQASKLLWGAHLLVIGAEYQDNLQQDQYYRWDKTDLSSVEMDSDDTSHSWALYVQDEFHLRDDLVLNIGLRHDQYSTFGGSTNPRGALIYNPLDKTTLKLLYGKAFRAPNVYETSYDDGYYQLGNTDLEPETIETYELVVEQYLTDNFRAVVSGFYYQIEDLIDQTTIVNDPADEDDDQLIFENVSEVDAWGVEFELEGKLDNGVSGRFSYTYQDTEDKDSGQTLSNSPEHLAKLNLTVPIWQEKVFLGIEQLYTSSKITTDLTEKVDSFAITNLTLFGQQLYEGLELSASVYNIFDEDYEVPGGGEHVQTKLPQPGRTFRLKLSYLF